MGFESQFPVFSLFVFGRPNSVNGQVKGIHIAFPPLKKQFGKFSKTSKN